MAVCRPLPMRPPAPVIQAVRQAWHWQWLRLMAGLGPADAEGRYRRPAPAFGEPPPLPADAADGGHLLIVGRSCPWAHRAWLVWSLRQLQNSITCWWWNRTPGRALAVPGALRGLPHPGGALPPQRRPRGQPRHGALPLQPLRGEAAGERERRADRSAEPLALPRGLDLAPPEQAAVIGPWRERLQAT